MAIRTKRFLFWLILGILALTVLTIWNYSAVKTTIRWWLWSGEYKAKVVSQTASSNTDFHHIEWDGWGWAGMNTVIYLVFDPTDSLSSAAKSQQVGRFKGVPCEVYRVSRLESKWYTVQFYTGEDWESCN